MRSLVRKHKLAIPALILLLASVLVFASWSRFGSKANDASTEAAKEAAAEATADVMLASPGRIEGASEVINVGAGADG
ncbi:MAG TPA: hypothetical protein VLU47_10760, partial [Blastocatellia bacterium]|nr:hypothetical protein [Blastocatellia bacterium]